MLEGLARQLSFAAVFLSSIGWVVFCVGFGIRNEWLTTSRGDNVLHSEYFSHWCLAVCPVLLYLISFIHLLCGNKITGALTLMLAPLFLVAAGGVLQTDGVYLYKYYSHHSVEFEDHVPIEFAGALAAALCYWLTLILWMFSSDKKRSSSRPTYEPINTY